MLTFLVFVAVAMAIAGLGVFAVPLLLVAAVIWLVLLPIKLLVGFIFGGLFRLVFGLIGALLGLVLAPIVLVIAGVAMVGAFITGMVALLAPLMPVILLLLLGWGIFRLVRPKVQTTGQYHTF
jgi:hypothetical protein